MACFAEALDAFLKRPENRVTTLAERIGTSQPNVTRYRSGERFPDAETARAIERETAGAVPFSLWRQEFLRRAGIEDAGDHHGGSDTPPDDAAATGNESEMSGLSRRDAA